MQHTPIKPSQEILDLYDKYAHGLMSRRTFFERLSAYAVGGLTVAALAESVLPNYALAEQVKADDERIMAEDVPYQSPKGAGDMMGYLVMPKDASAAHKKPGVVVIHENRGLNPYIRDVARRVAVAGYIAFAPDALYPLGGYPGNDDDGRTMQRQRDTGEMVEDFAAAVTFLQNHEASTGNVGCVGFCFGGSVSNRLAAKIPSLKASVPFYGGGVPAEDVPAIQAPLLIHLGELDERVNAGWPAYEEALKANGKDYEMHMYEGANHGFHNDTTPRYDAHAAELAWARTLAFFEKHLS
ncbi:dienelactone hydrolase family protein [Kordiimonas gwangyangensis]|uniref:dienelactone hydrolase family protein n=1 Tax=Kordiimonas gwangyangensis TaxID=288022 RepID=UPI00035CCE9D|nr:dienelactone hydrolase family protein [Kordiimonas gwangyangensis]